eukprot:s467_g4.t1
MIQGYEDHILYGQKDPTANIRDQSLAGEVQPLMKALEKRFGEEPRQFLERLSYVTPLQDIEIRMKRSKGFNKLDPLDEWTFQQDEDRKKAAVARQSDNTGGAALYKEMPSKLARPRRSAALRIGVEAFDHELFRDLKRRQERPPQLHFRPLRSHTSALGDVPIVTCIKGGLSASYSSCEVACLTSASASVTVGSTSHTVNPAARMVEAGTETKQCSDLATRYAGTMSVSCSQGSITVDAAGCSAECLTSDSASVTLGPSAHTAGWPKGR